MLVREFFRNAGGQDFDAHAGAPGDFSGLPLQGRDQAEIVEHRRAQQERQVADHADGIFDQLLRLFGFVGGGGEVFGADECGEVGHLDEHAGEGLADFVVQLAGDGLPLLLLNLHEPGR